MRIKLDENLPSSVVRDLSRLGHDVDTVIEEGLTGQRDHEIWETVQQTQRFLITQDLDFSDVRSYRPGVKQAGLLIVRLRQTGRSAVAARVRDIFQTEAVEDWIGCLVVAIDHKIRIRRLN